MEKINFGLEESALRGIISLVLVTLTTLLILWWRYRVFPQLGRKLPPGQLGLPLIGESISFLNAIRKYKIAEWVRKRTIKYGPIFKTSVMGSTTVVITGQAGNRFIFSASDTGIAGNQPASVRAILGNNSIFELSGPRYKLLKGAIINFLKPESIQRYVCEMDSLVKKQLFKELNGQDSVKVVPLMKKVTFKVTCSLIFGLPQGKELVELLENFTIALKGIWCIPFNFPGTMYRKSSIARAKIRKLFTQLIDRRRRELEERKASSHQDIISSLLSLRDEDGLPLLEEEIIDNLITLMIASHDTTTTLLAFLVRLLSWDARVHDKVLEEQKEVAKISEGNGGKLSWRELQMMKYTWSVAQELMRLDPPVLGNFRLAWRDTSFDGFDIPKGWQVLWVASSTHMDGEIFGEPENFDPSKFQTPTKSMPPYTYVPFGAGQRICPGAEFARIEVLLIIHHLITTYRWTAEIPNEPIIGDPMPNPAMGLPIKLYPRKNI